MRGSNTGLSENEKQFYRILVARLTHTDGLRFTIRVYECPNLQRPLLRSVSRVTTRRLSTQQTPQNPSLQS
jgi:hypothetical protein